MSIIPANRLRQCGLESCLFSQVCVCRCKEIREQPVSIDFCVLGIKLRLELLVCCTPYWAFFFFLCQFSVTLQATHKCCLPGVEHLLASLDPICWNHTSSTFAVQPENLSIQAFSWGKPGISKSCELSVFHSKTLPCLCIVFTVFMCCLCICMHTTCMQAAHGYQKRVSHPFESELDMVMNSLVSPGKRSQNS